MELNNLRGKGRGHRCGRSPAERVVHFQKASSAIGGDEGDFSIEAADRLRQNLSGEGGSRSVAELDKDFSFEEVWQALSVMKDGATGIDGVSVKLLKACSKEYIMLLAQIFSKMRAQMRRQLNGRRAS